jgi:hypothetical protein
MTLLHELFGFERRASAGERVHLRCFELCVLAWALYYVWKWAAEIPRMRDIVLPMGVANWLDVSFMFAVAPARANAVLCTILLLLGALRAWRPAYALGLLLMHLQYAARDVLGEISHGSNLVGTALVGMALGALLETDALQQRRFGFGFSVLFTGIGYLSAGICKLIATGPQWVSGQHLLLWIHERGVDALSKHGAVHFNWLQQMAMERRWIATLILVVGLSTELAAWLGWWRTARPVCFGALIGMHLGIWLSMDILFDTNMYLLVVLAFPWGLWLDRLVLWRPALGPRLARRLQS